ncbi:MAG: hypothetical protein ACNI3A_14100 [Desulfovibrio sp.]|uniref:hypothetical protein n=1 Tax=Desulfovibrio sp. 7SRBS1 TaxID=3378064 RepID=UPI003B40F0F1
MGNFQWGKKTIEFKRVTGEVLSSEKNTKTFRSHNINSSEPVQTEIFDNHSVWIKKDNGIEKYVTFHMRDIPIRTGQRVSVIYSFKDKTNYWPAILVNHAAKDIHYVEHTYPLMEKLGLGHSGFYTSLFLILITLFGAGYGFNAAGYSGWKTLGYSMLAGFVVFLYLMNRGDRIRTKRRNAFVKHLRTLSDNVESVEEMA